MKLLFSSDAWADYVYWEDSDRAILGRINDLIKDTMRTPFTAIFLGNRLLGTILLEQNDESAVQRARLIPERWTAERTNLACWFDVLIQAKDI